MKDLLIVIVSYKVKAFLAQTLLSVQSALEGINSTVRVVDNCSNDGTVEYIRSNFPWVELIACQKNLGFSGGNNLGLQDIKQYKYVLLLNPDTVVPEGCLRECISFMEQHPKAGALGVKMVDGEGNFLPESKRGLPTPIVAFYKIIGLNKLFPNSKTFARYYLGHLSENEVQEVEILSGAFMFFRSETLQQVGLLDEAFFMYGEDIDLSYRILLAGYQNYYLPSPTIIHYKGESTKKDSLRYVKIFYEAMAIFAQKHFFKKSPTLINWAIELAIIFRATLAAFRRFIKTVRYPLIDGSIIAIGMFVLKEYWQANHKRVPGDYPPDFMLLVVPAYILIWLSCVWLSGGYRKKVQFQDFIYGIGIGTVVISAVTNFFDNFRFSKALILLGGGWAGFSLFAWRLLWDLRKQTFFSFEQTSERRYLLRSFSEDLSNDVSLNLKSKAGLNIVERLAKPLLSVSEIENTKSNLALTDIVYCHDIQSNSFFQSSIQEIIKLKESGSDLKVWHYYPELDLALTAKSGGESGKFHDLGKDGKFYSREFQDQLKRTSILIAWVLLVPKALSFRLKLGSYKSLLTGKRLIWGIGDNKSSAIRVSEGKAPQHKKKFEELFIEAPDLWYLVSLAFRSFKKIN